MKKNICLILIGIVCFSFSLHAQYQLSGKVTDEKGKPVNFATVMIMSQDTLAGGGATNEKGTFRIDGLAAGDYTLTLSILGYKPVKQPFTLAGDLKLPTIALAEEAKALDEVVVSADRRNLIQTGAGFSVFHLSERAAQAIDAFEALREIPQLLIDETNRRITLNDGKEPLILVNGVNRPGYISSLSPEDIESVEVIRNPSARYRGDEAVSAILNIKTKRKKEQAYVNGNLYSRHHVEGVFGVSGGSVETGNSKSSLYFNAQHFYFHNDDAKTYERSRNADWVREMEGGRRYRSNMIYLNLGGDWIVSDKNYWAFGVTFITHPSTLNTSNEGRMEQIQEQGDPITSSLRSTQETKNKYHTNTYSLYYKHTFAEANALEATATFGWFGSGARGNRTEQTGAYAYRNVVDLDNDKKSFKLDLNYGFPVQDKVLFDIGAATYMQRTDVDDRANLFPLYIYKDLREYAYVSVRNKQNTKFSYMLSAGMDMVFTNADGKTNRYVNFSPSLSLGYQTTAESNLQLDFSRRRTPPSVEYLNPRNTSTDSLYRNMGNPYLKPYIDNIVTLSWMWNHKGIYLQPYVTYDYCTDVIEPVGRMEGNVYVQTYENSESMHQLQAGISSRVNLSKYGNLNLTVYYQKDFIDGLPFSGNSVIAQGNLYLYYKQVSLSINAWYSNYRYTRTSRSWSTPESEATFTWRLPKNISLQAGLRYFAAANNRSTTLIRDGAYDVVRRMKMTDRFFMPMIGLSYFFKNKINTAWRQKKQLYNTDEGVGSIKAQ